MNRRLMLVLTVLGIFGTALSASAVAIFPASGTEGAIALGFPDACFVPLRSVQALPTAKVPTDTQVAAVERGLDGIMSSVVFADAALAKSEEPKAKMDEAKRVLAQVRQLVANARNELSSVPRGDKTGKLRKRLLPVAQQLYAIPYPPLLRPGGK